MSKALFASIVSRAGRRLLTAALLLCSLVGPIPQAAAQDANVTAITVRFRDLPATAEPAASPTPRQLHTISTTLRTGIVDWSATKDGTFRVTLAPPLTFAAAREAVSRLRLDEGVLHASIAATDAPAAKRERDESTRRPGPPLSRLIVRYRGQQAAADAAANVPLRASELDVVSALAGQPVAHERAMGWAGAHLLRVFQPMSEEEMEALAARLEQRPEVLWAQPDYLYQINLVPNDPQFAYQWHYHAPGAAAGTANLTAAWEVTTGWSGVRVAVIDTGALYGHPDMAGRWIGGYDFISANILPVNANDGDGRDGDPSDPGDWLTIGECGGGNPPSPSQLRNSSWHGTHVAGTIGAATNNGVGVAGVNWVSRIVPLRVLGKCGGTTADITDAMVWAAGGTVTGAPANPYPARVLNLSLGGYRASRQCDALAQVATNTVLALGSTIVISAGNDDLDASFMSPGNCNGVVTVAAVGRFGQRAPYSNHDANDGSGLQVEIAAPGGAMADDGTTGGVLSTLNSGTTIPDPGGYSYAYYNGTSMAAPHVAGIASLMLSLKPSLTPAQVLAHLTNSVRGFPTATGRDCTNNLANATGTTRYCGAGIVDAAAALANVLGTGNGGGAMAIATATLGSSANPSVPGTPVTFTATVSSTAVPVGTVAFTYNDVVIAGCGAVALSGAGTTRTAQCLANLPAGGHQIRASYLPTSTATTADDSPILIQVVGSAGVTTTTTVESNADPVAQGTTITFNATVTGLDPTGTVQFRSNGVAIPGCGAAALTGSGNIRTASCVTNQLVAGLLTISAVYSGDATNAQSTGSMQQGVFGPGACVVFNDVAGNDPFCNNVQWIYNRGITLGCDSVDYCPNGPVSRLAMAAFMNRQGTALTPVDLPVAFFAKIVDLASATVVCATGEHTFSGFPRRATIRMPRNLFEPGGNMEVRTELVYSTNNGTSWNVIPGTQAFQSLYGGRTPPDDQTVTMYGELDLAVGTPYRFGMRAQRTAGSGDVFLYCANFVQVRNRNASAPPL